MMYLEIEQVLRRPGSSTRPSRYERHKRFLRLFFAGFPWLRYHQETRTERRPNNSSLHALRDAFFANITYGSLSSLPAAHAVKLTGMYSSKCFVCCMLQPSLSITAGGRPRARGCYSVVNEGVERKKTKKRQRRRTEGRRSRT